MFFVLVGSLSLSEVPELEESADLDSEGADLGEEREGGGLKCTWLFTPSISVPCNLKSPCFFNIEFVFRCD